MAKSRSEAAIVGIMTVVIPFVFLFHLLFIGGALVPSILGAVTMGLFTALLGMVSYRYRGYLQRKAFEGKKKASDSIRSHQRSSVEIDLPYGAAFDLALEALQTLNRQEVPQPEPDNWLMRAETWVPRKQLLRIYDEDRTSGTIRAGLRSKVFGLDNVLDFSQIDLRLERVASGTTRIDIASKPATLSEYYDLGKNRHYVNWLAHYIRRESHQMSAESRLTDAAEADESQYEATPRRRAGQRGG